MDPSQFHGATTSVVCPDDPLSSMPGEGTADDPRSTLGERHTGQLLPSTKVPSHFELLYCTLVADSAVPDGYLADFLKLEVHARRSAQRTRAQYVSKSTDSAARELRDLQRQQSSKEENGQSAR